MCVCANLLLKFIVHRIKDNEKIKRQHAAELSSLTPRSAPKKDREFITRGQCSEFCAIMKTSRSSNVTFDGSNYTTVHEIKVARVARSS